jgi:signal transduction histidine kinase
VKRAVSSSLRLRLAVGMTALALGIAAVVGLGAAALAAWRSPSHQPEVSTRVDRIGPVVAVVQIQQDPNGAAAAAKARSTGVRWLLATLAVAFVPAAGLAWIVAGRVVKRVARVAEVAEQVHEPGAPERVGAPPRDDELGRLAEGFDRMLDRLDEREREQRRMLQDVVHELRTPLAVAMTNLELEGPEHVAAAQRALERMSRTVDDLTTHGGLHAGAADESIDLAAEARELTAEQVGPAARRGLRLEMVGHESAIVRTNRVAVRTAVGNLLSNAVRLAPAGSVIRTGWGEHAGWAWIGVRDEGPGIEVDDQPRVFERHWQGRYERDRGERPEGGLGLTIARQLTEALGGAVTVSSTIGRGSSFVVWLPMTADARREDIVAADGIHPVVELWPAVPA